MTNSRLTVLTALALVAFAANSLLCRWALAHTSIDAASFTTLRLASGAAVLVLLMHVRGASPIREGQWRSGFALFVYAAGFSFAYLHLGAATGALLLFGAVQASMILVGLWRGERFRALQWGGIVIAAMGLLALLLPGATAPSLLGAVLMLAAGIAWGMYSLWGRSADDAAAATAGNFMRALPFALVLSVLMLGSANIDAPGALLAMASGALASGLGYVLWYTVLPHLASLRAAALQLVVPPMAALGGVLLLNESMSARLVFASVAVLGGVALVLRGKMAAMAAPAR